MNRKIRYILLFFLGVTSGYIIFWSINQKKLIEKDKRIDKFVNYFKVMDRWMLLKETNNNPSDILGKMGYNNVAIYGMGKLGQHLLEDLKKTDVKVKYGIDKKVDSISLGLDILPVSSDLPYVDAVIITPVYDFDNIEKELKGKINFPLLSLEELLYS